MTGKSARPTTVITLFELRISAASRPTHSFKAQPQAPACDGRGPRRQDRVRPTGAGGGVFNEPSPTARSRGKPREAQEDTRTERRLSLLFRVSLCSLWPPLFRLCCPIDTGVAEQALTGMKSWGQYLGADGVLVAAVCNEPAREDAGPRQKALLGIAPSDGSVLWKLPSEAGSREGA